MQRKTDLPQEPSGVVLYGPGAIGQQVARLLLERNWPIAAVLNRAGPKVGKDLSELCDLPAPTGIVVQDEQAFDPQDVAADIAIITSTDRVAINLPVYERFLSAGLNVICVGCEASWPAAASPEIADRIDALAREKGVTFTGSGFQDVQRHWLGRALVGTCTQLRAFEHSSATDIAPHGAETARLVRAGLSPKEFAESVAAAGQGEVSIYRVFFEQFARSLAIEIESVEESLEPCFLDADQYCPPLDRVIPAGQVVGTQYKTVIRAKGGIIGTARNELRLFASTEVPVIGWKVDGDPPAELRVTGFDSYQGTAAPLVNRIPDVLRAPPGLVTLDRLGPPSFPGNP